MVLNFKHSFDPLTVVPFSKTESGFIACKFTLGCKRWFYARIKRGYFSKYDQTVPVNIGLLWYFTASSLILLRFSFNFIFKVKLTPHSNTFVLSSILMLISVWMCHKTQCYHCLVITSLGVPPSLQTSRVSCLGVRSILHQRGKHGAKSIDFPHFAAWLTSEVNAESWRCRKVVNTLTKERPRAFTTLHLLATNAGDNKTDHCQKDDPVNLVFLYGMNA